jgi:hypothetical protein
MHICLVPVVCTRLYASLGANACSAHDAASIGFMIRRDVGEWGPGHIVCSLAGGINLHSHVPLSRTVVLVNDHGALLQCVQVSWHGAVIDIQ